MAIRQFLLPMAMTLPFTILQIAFDPYLFDANYWTDPTYYDYALFGSLASLLMILLSLAVSLLDALWIFKGGQNHRIVDVWAKTDVLNTSATVRN
jgi:hypothetical protein